MPRLAQLVWVVVALAALVSAQVHVSAEFDPCLWAPKPAGGGSRLPGHATGGHGCHGCVAGNAAVTLAHPVAAVHLAAARLEVRTAQIEFHSNLTQACSTRAPPAA